MRAFCLLPRLDSPFITNLAPISVSTGHSATETNPLEQITSLEQTKASALKCEGNVSAEYTEFKKYEKQNRTTHQRSNHWQVVYFCVQITQFKPLKLFDKTQDSREPEKNVAC